MDKFSQYQALFTEPIHDEKVAVCKWYEAGTTIDTALPDIRNLTDDKKEWRAIIVRYVDDTPMSGFKSDPRNPFDFEINMREHKQPQESEIPLIRLTHMLGGVPPLEMEFEAEVIKEDYKASRTVYLPVENPQRERAHEELEAKYVFDGKPPTSVLLVSVRDGSMQGKNIDRAWRTHKESDSSSFWKRNFFPANCRFLVYDFSKQGPVQNQVDSFSFWYGVMLLSVNEWDAGTIQAYRLYTMKVVMDQEKMSDSFQMLIDKLRTAKNCLSRSIKQDMDQGESEDETLPEYSMEVPIPLKIPKRSENEADANAYSLFSEGTERDLKTWVNQRNEAEEEYAAIVKTAERALEQTADRMRPACIMEESEVIPLSRYQIEDMTEKTENIYHQIIEIQAELPSVDISSKPDVADSAKSVRQFLSGRLTFKPAIVTVAAVTVMIFLSGIPALLKQEDVWIVLLKETGIATVMVIFVAFSVLVMQKTKLTALISEYNQKIKDAFTALREHASEYSDYMTNIASLSRGKSYMNCSDKINAKEKQIHYLKYKHLKAIGVLLDKLALWGKAFRLQLDFTAVSRDTRVEIDVSTSPLDNSLYAFETRDTYQVAVNRSGMYMESPYPFAEKIEIIREELYDDD